MFKVEDNLMVLRLLSSAYPLGRESLQDLLADFIDRKVLLFIACLPLQQGSGKQARDQLIESLAVEITSL